MTCCLQILLKSALLGISCAGSFVLVLRRIDVVYDSCVYHSLIIVEARIVKSRLAVFLILSNVTVENVIKTHFNTQGVLEKRLVDIGIRPNYPFLKIIPTMSVALEKNIHLEIPSRL